MKHCETGRLRKFWGVVNSSVHVADCNQEGVGDDDHVHGTAGDQKDRRWLLTIRWYEGRKESALHASFSRFWDWQTTWQHVWNLMNRKGLYAQGSLTCTRNGWLNLVLTTCSACQRVWATLLMEFTPWSCITWPLAECIILVLTSAECVAIDVQSFLLELELRATLHLWVHAFETRSV